MSFEQALLQRAQQFDRQALSEIYDCYSPALYRYAVRLLGTPDLAEECVAEVFSRFLHVLRNGKGPRDHLQAYLYRVAHNWIADQWRRQPPTPLELDGNLPADGQSDPSQTVAAQFEQAQVRAALAQLTPDQRQVVVLKFLEGLENEEIALMLGKPTGAVKSLQHRALAALRRAMPSEEIRYEPVE
ncbi:MAG: sigma-70 family RNA polymerase sigma factor [Chloroflexi bacterium]|nr:sigma-70 family RNA polymerase sigma factor [Chloroflexota bacterium]